MHHVMSMVHNKNSVPSQPSLVSETAQGRSITADITGNSSGRGSDLNGDERVDTPKYQTDAPSQVAHEVWDALKEEFYEQVEQLPLSLHRSFALIGEQDEEVEACRTELLPTIRSYIKLRQSLFTALAPQYPDPETTGNEPGPELKPEDHESIRIHHTEITSGVSLKTSSHVGPSAAHIDTIVSENSSSMTFNASQPASTRMHGLRESDASVPKSVPFPPRPRPKTTRELLTRIAFLMAEVIRASEEKVGLATAAYDSVDRHVRVLDTAIKEHEVAAAHERSTGTWHAGRSRTDANDPTAFFAANDDDEEPQLGMIGPSGYPGDESVRRGKKRDRRDKRIHVQPVTPASRVSVLPAVAQPELPVDPHEPRYCYCHQVSYGEMIACDNTECSREWFHLGCAGLSAPPKDKVKWYCRDCEEAKRKRKAR